MSTGLQVAVILYTLATLQAGVFGLVFAIRNRPMPYHLDALGDARFEDLPLGAQVLLNNGIGLIGGASLAIAVALAGLIAGPLVEGALWARFLVPLVAVMLTLAIVRAARAVEGQTPARPPMWLLWLALGLQTSAFVLSWL